MKGKSISAYLENVLFAVLFFIVFPFLWIREKLDYYTNERKILKHDINHLRALLRQTERERDEYQAKARSFEYYQSENERLRRILSSKGYNSKKLKNLHINT